MFICPTGGYDGTLYDPAQMERKAKISNDLYFRLSTSPNRQNPLFIPAIFQMIFKHCDNKTAIAFADTCLTARKMSQKLVERNLEACRNEQRITNRCISQWEKKSGLKFNEKFSLKQHQQFHPLVITMFGGIENIFSLPVMELPPESDWITHYEESIVPTTFTASVMRGTDSKCNDAGFITFIAIKNSRRHIYSLLQNGNYLTLCTSTWKDNVRTLYGCLNGFANKRYESDDPTPFEDFKKFWDTHKKTPTTQ